MTLTRDDILRMAREAGLCTSTGACALVGGSDLTPFLQRFASLAVADAMARGLSAPIVVNTADIDPALLRDMLAKAPAALVPAPAEPTHEAIATAVADEREACAALVASWNTAMTDKLAAAIRARGAA